MADLIPETQPFFNTTMKWFGISGASLEVQFNRFIFHPLLEVFAPSRGHPEAHSHTGLGKRRQSSSGPFLFILDGLDECDDREEVAALLDNILDFFKRNPEFPLRFLISSRIEEHIRSHIQDGNVHIENLHDHSAQADIMTLVRHTFQGASEKSRVIRSYGEQWPSEADVSRLAGHADGSFVFISTLLKYILDGVQGDGLTPMARFTLALDMHGLDNLYQDIMQRAKGQGMPHFCEVVLAIALIRMPLSISHLSRFLGIPAYEVVNSLVPLQSIFQVPVDDEADVTVYHASLREFIQDENRSAQVFASSDRDPVHTRLAYRSLDTRLRLAFYAVPQSLQEGWLEQYAQQHWSSHWEELRGSMKPHIDFLICVTRSLGVAENPAFQIA